MAKLTSSGIRFAGPPTVDEITTRHWMFQGPDDPNGAVQTKWIFYQANAPTGWTKVTNLDDHALRVVSGNGGGPFGTKPFTSMMTSNYLNYGGSFGGNFNVLGIPFTTSSLPVHNHPMNVGSGSSYYLTANPAEFFPDNSFKQWTGGDVRRPAPGQTGQWTRTSPATAPEGGTGTHDHSVSFTISFNQTISLAVRYIDVIVCSFNG